MVPALRLFHFPREEEVNESSIFEHAAVIDTFLITYRKPALDRIFSHVSDTGTRSRAV